MGVKKKPTKSKKAIAARSRNAKKPAVKKRPHVPEGKLEQSRRRSSIDTVAPHSPYIRVDVRILFFGDHDLAGQEENLQDVKTAFESFNYNVEVIQISVENAWLNLEKQLKFLFYTADKDTLQIIYYSGHGCECDQEHDVKSNSHADLYLCSHASGDNPRYSEINWSDVSPLMMASSSDTLVILDCCSAGSSNLSPLVEDDDIPIPYRKVVMITSAQNQVSYQGDFSKAFCQVLRSISEQESDISTETLLYKANSVTFQQPVRSERRPVLSYHCVPHRSTKPKIVLHRLAKKSVWNGRKRSQHKGHIVEAGMTRAENSGAGEDGMDTS